MKNSLNNTYQDILIETSTTSDNIYQRLDAMSLLIVSMLNEIKELKAKQDKIEMKDYDTEYFK